MQANSKASHDLSVHLTARGDERATGEGEAAGEGAVTSDYTGMSIFRFSAEFRFFFSGLPLFFK